MQLTSFAPVIGDSPRILILGSMPGRLSLEKQQYYAHPRNAFWSIMGEVCGACPHISYAARLEKLKAAGIGLWDVLQHCERVGSSLDSAIAVDTEIPNKIIELLVSYRTIDRILFNGGKAFESFRRHILTSIQDDFVIELIQLPSSSPAHARLSLEQKKEIWLKAINC